MKVPLKPLPAAAYSQPLIPSNVLPSWTTLNFFIAGAVRQRDGAHDDVAECRFLLLFAALPSLVAAAMLRLVDSDQDRYFETIYSADHRLYPLPR